MTGIPFPAEAGIFLVAIISRPAVGLTQPPNQWVTGRSFLGGKAARGVNLTTHLHLVQ